MDEKRDPEQLPEYDPDSQNVSEAVPETGGQAFPAWKGSNQLEPFPGTDLFCKSQTLLFYE